MSDDTFVRLPLLAAFEFHRDHGDDVWALVLLDFGVVLTVGSEAPHSPREWTLEEIDVPGIEMRFRSSASPIPYETDLGRALAKAWDIYVSREARAVYTPENRGSAEIAKEAL